MKLFEKETTNHMASSRHLKFRSKQNSRSSESMKCNLPYRLENHSAHSFGQGSPLVMTNQDSQKLATGTLKNTGQSRASSCFVINGRDNSNSNVSDNTDERRIKLKNEYLYTRFKNPDQLDFGVKQRNHFEESGKLEKDLSCLQEITESEVTQ